MQIGHRQTSHQAPDRASLGIFANTVNTPSLLKRKPLTAKDEASESGRKARFQLQRAAQGLLPSQRVV